jgi:hypothetical protein
VILGIAVWPGAVLDPTNESTCVPASLLGKSLGTETDTRRSRLRLICAFLSRSFPRIQKLTNRLSRCRRNQLFEPGHNYEAGLSRRPTLFILDEAI